MNAIVLFKNNLRYNDNPVLFHSVSGNKILPIYIHDEININKPLGSSSKYWLHHSLISLNKKLNNNLHYYNGDTFTIIKKLVNTYSISTIYCEESFLDNDIMFFDEIKKSLEYININLEFYNCNLLWKPYEILKNDQTPYKVFTPYYKRGCLNAPIPNKPEGQPSKINFIKTKNNTSIDDLNLLDNYKWYEKFNKIWKISEDDALNIFKLFLKEKINDYKKERDFPALEKNSKLSPYIRFGLISVNRIWYELNKLPNNKGVEHFKSEIGWREFSYYLLHHFPRMEKNNLQTKFDNFNWENSEEKFDAWKKGETGYPIVDAGMRELWQTGFIHNRTRMVVASFLVKNLLIDWRLGEEWFWDCLVDADYASNIAGWQWVSGTGADAAPYFRIFNPILQGNKFDPEGKYIKYYVPELKDVPLKLLNEPWNYPNKTNYTKPIVDYKYSRERALSKYEEIK
tara:strand:+ start:1728 stop:3095 length:1368 start_codon:yes stop_codon:yes gene_type:complete